jgi:hypothetical protein
MIRNDGRMGIIQKIIIIGEERNVKKVDETR